MLYLNKRWMGTSFSNATVVDLLHLRTANDRILADEPTYSNAVQMNTTLLCRRCFYLSHAGIAVLADDGGCATKLHSRRIRVSTSSPPILYHLRLPSLRQDAARLGTMLNSVLYDIDELAKTASHRQPYVLFSKEVPFFYFAIAPTQLRNARATLLLC